MSSSERGRHKAGRHAAPKKPRSTNKHVGALFSLASVGTVAVTGASTVAHSSSTHTTILADPAPATPNLATPANTQITDAAATRAEAASRSESRTSLSDAQTLDEASTAADPTTVTTTIDTTPTVDATQRRALAGIAPSTDALTNVVDQAQQQAQAQAQQLLTLQQEQKAAAEQATKDAAQALLAAQEAADIGIKEPPIHGSYQLTARFGQRGYMWSEGWHTGLDFAVHVGTSVYPCAAGKIIFAGWAGAYGNRIEIQHPDGYVTAYNHLSKIEISSGIVLPNQEIAKSGATGNVTGPHVHLEVTKNGVLENPATWLWGSNR